MRVLTFDNGLGKVFEYFIISPTFSYGYSIFIQIHVFTHYPKFLQNKESNTTYIEIPHQVYFLSYLNPHVKKRSQFSRSGGFTYTLAPSQSKVVKLEFLELCRFPVRSYCKHLKCIGNSRFCRF